MDREKGFTKGHSAGVPSGKASPRRLIGKLVLAILLTESAVMLFLHLMSGYIGHGSLLEIIIDPVLLAAMLLPVLFMLVFKPMMDAINKVKASEDSLRFEKERLLNIFETMEDGVAIINRDYEVDYANPALEREFGQWKGRRCFDYLHDRQEPCPRCPNQRVFAGETVRWEWWSFKNKKTYDLIDSPLRNPDNTISKLEIFRDITESKVAEARLKERLEDLERFQKATIGRELRLKELKDRIKTLEDKIKGINNKQD